MLGFGRVKPFHVQPLVQIFADECARLHAASFPHPWTGPDLERLIGAADCLGEAAVESRGRVLFGFVLSRRVLDEAEILTVAVDAPLRRSGIGRRLMDVHLPRLARFGTRTVFLEVAETNKAALKLYARLGFEEVGRRANYTRTASGGHVTALTMRRRLA